MILYFSEFIKHLDKKTNNPEHQPGHQYKAVYEEIVSPGFNKTLPYAACPIKDSGRKCGAIGSLSYHASYKRAAIRDIVNGEIVEYYDVEIDRVICSQCKTTHALLVWFLPPWSSHTLRFILFVLEIYYLDTMTIEAICVKFDITHPTLYTWVKKYQSQYDDLRKLLKPPMLPDVPLQFEQCESMGGPFRQTEAIPPSVARTGTEATEEAQARVAGASVGGNEHTVKRKGLLSDFLIKVFIAIKGLVVQDTPAIFREFHAAYHIAFFQARQIQSRAGGPRASPNNR